MIDAALIKQCADPTLTPAIVEKFVAAVGSDNPLALSITSGKRVILTPPATSPEEAVKLIQSHVGRAVVRVGLTQLPAGIGATDPGEIATAILDPCTNIRLGTQLFGKVYRIVVKWYGIEREEAFSDAISAWKTGYFEGDNVFSQPDPGPLKGAGKTDLSNGEELAPGAKPELVKSHPPQSSAVTGGGEDPNKAGIRIDLGNVYGQKQD